MNSPTSSSSLSEMLRGAQSEEEEALAALWQRYYPNLVRFAEQRMIKLGLPRRIADGEDVAASALGSFFRAVQQDRFHDVRDENGLLRFLFKITVWKVIDRKRQHNALKAGGGREVGESVLVNPDQSFQAGIDGLAGDALRPDVLATMEEELCGLLLVLEDDELRELVGLRLEGYDNAEIAARNRCSLATVERRFKLIREIWTEALERETK